jgi:hypothetical protein
MKLTVRTSNKKEKTLVDIDDIKEYHLINTPLTKDPSGEPTFFHRSGYLKLRDGSEIHDITSSLRSVLKLFQAKVEREVVFTIGRIGEKKDIINWKYVFEK